ncbi:MAG: transposase, partial [Fibrobacterota bacterium]
YFITVCIHDRSAMLLGDIRNGEAFLNEYGKFVAFTWNDLLNHVNNIQLDEFIIMPNHVHGIIRIVSETGEKNTTTGPAGSIGAGSEPAPTEPAPTEPAPTEPVPTDKLTPILSAPVPHKKPLKSHSLPEIVRQFKTFSARRINSIRNTPGIPVWQRNYYEHIIRDENSLNSIRHYIRNNPVNWSTDPTEKTLYF